MNIVDSSGWLEFFSDGGNAEAFAEPLGDVEALLVPAICLYEVFKVVLRERGENEALQAVAVMEQGTVADLTADLALSAARISLESKLPMADSIIFATAERYAAMIWTQDEDFAGRPSVRYFPKTRHG
jgi:toxin FitB